MPVKPIPDGFTAITPFLVINDVKAQIEFLKSAFGGTLDLALTAPDGTVMYAEVTVYGAKVMMGPAGPRMAAVPTMIYLYVHDVDAVVAKAAAAGGKPQGPVTDMFYGDRVGYLSDPQGNFWCIATHKQDLTPEQITENMGKMMKG